MIKKCLGFALICLLAAAGGPRLAAQTNTDNDAAAEAKIKAKILKRGTGENKRVKVKLRNGTELNGFIRQTNDDSFELTDPGTKQSAAIAYRDVARIKGSGLSKGATIAIGVSVAAGIAAVVLGIFFKRYCNEQAC